MTRQMPFEPLPASDLFSSVCVHSIAITVPVAISFGPS